MQKLIATVIISLLFTYYLPAQVPQSICYQAVATDQAGRELINQNIKVRVSILKSAVNGSEEWVETHSVITDGFGLFDFQIGNGTRTGGSQTQFNAIKWGQDKFYLKVEMDITGGNNFILMGTNQMVSVPYALFAEKAQTAVIADTAKWAVIADSAKRAAIASRAVIADSSLKSQYATMAQTAIKADSSNYAFTAQKALLADSSYKSHTAITAYSAIKADSAKFATLADSARKAGQAQRAIIADSSYRSYSAVIAQTAAKADSAKFANNSDNAKFANLSDNSKFATLSQRAIIADSSAKSYSSVIATTATKADSARFAWYADSSRRANQAQRAILADSSLRSQTATYALSAQRAFISDSTVKAGTAYNAIKADTASVAKTALDDLDKDPRNEIQTLSLKNDSLILSNPYGSASAVSFSSLPFRAPGASIEYPMGVYGDYMAITTDYTVPSGKNFFISATNSSVVLGDGRTLYAEPGMPIIPSGYRIAQCYCTGILVNEHTEIQPVILDFSSSIYEYTVPSGYTLIIKSGKTARGLLDLQIDSDIFNFYTVTSQTPRIIVINSGKRVKKPITLLPSDSLVLTGYLLKNK